MANREWITYICEECGKDIPLDEEQSTDDWKVYPSKCECGGESTIKLPEEEL